MEALSILSVSDDIKVESWQDTITISNKQAVLLICRHCGDTRNAYFHSDPSEFAIDVFKQCHCLEEKDPQSIYQALCDVYEAMSGCNTLDDARKMVLIMANSTKNQNI